MSELATNFDSIVLPREHGAGSRAGVFAAVCVLLAVLSAALAGWVPLGFSIVTVFLFAGPHNWMEFRYFLSKMPARWGPLRGFFVTGIGGVVVLTAAFATMPVMGRRLGWGNDEWGYASAMWNSVLVLWVAALVRMHFAGKRRPLTPTLSPSAKTGSGESTRSTPVGEGAKAWAFPVAFGLVAVAWWRPQLWDVGLVYLHPLVALWFLDREISRRRPAWRGAYHACLCCIPLLLAALWWRLADAPPLAGQDMLSMRITNHAGAGVLANLSPHALVSTHTFLEMLHYGVWLVAMPLVGMTVAPWQVTANPLARRSGAWKMVVIAIIAVGGLVVLGLWAGFVANYPLTRDVYFTIAIAHVLAEAPFLVRTF